MPAVMRYKAVLISAGFEHNLGISSDKQVICWGSNQFGQCDVPKSMGEYIHMIEQRNEEGIKIKKQKEKKEKDEDVGGSKKKKKKNKEGDKNENNDNFEIEEELNDNFNELERRFKVYREITEGL